jgi:Cytochrome bd terminal oxidase subunit I
LASEQGKPKSKQHLSRSSIFAHHSYADWNDRMSLDPLSRLQFAWVTAWHILLPAFTVGLASYMAVVEGLHFATGREI